MTSDAPVCPWCGGSGLVVPSPFAPEVDRPESYPSWLARSPWGYPTELAERLLQVLRPAPCPRGCECEPATPFAVHVQVQVDDPDDDEDEDEGEGFHLIG